MRRPYDPAGMTARDIAMIEEALTRAPWEWTRVADIEDTADTPQARAELKSIRCALYHREEAMNGGC